MREIEFRGKRKDGDSWVYGYLYKHSSFNPIRTTCIIFDDAGRDIPLTGRYEVLPETVGEFSGLINKHKQKLWEGDRVNCPIYGEGVIIFKNGRFCLQHSGLKGSKGKFVGISSNYIYRNLEIIGTIHDEVKDGN